MATRGCLDRFPRLERRVVARWTPTGRHVGSAPALQGGRRAEPAGLPRDRRGFDLRPTFAGRRRAICWGARTQSAVCGGRVPVRVSVAAGGTAGRRAGRTDGVDIWGGGGASGRG